MHGLPSGTVTMLFSDIEGSTSMLYRLGSQWGEALSAQRAILRDVFSSHAGIEMGTEGDSFFVVFERAHHGLLAAVEGQRRLHRHDWPRGVSLQVRMGLHTGEPEHHEEGYIGLDVHRAARIAATASGGQIVLSTTTQTLVEAQCADLTLRDLGWHRLKDLAEPERLYDVAVPDLPSEFPALRSLGTTASLPAYSTDLVGRSEEVDRLCSLYEGGARLVTLLGPGGTGKTRLAVAVAGELQHRRPCDLYFVELHTTDRSTLMWSAIAEALGAPAEVDVLPHTRVLTYLQDRTVLLVLDNLEQIVDAEQVVAELLSHAPGAQVLTTSRRSLHLVDEHVFPVEPLSLPSSGRSDPAAAHESAAVELFVRRAAMVQPHFSLTAANAADVVDLCRHLDGLPLAIELTAARSRLLSPRAMLRRIEQHDGGLPGPADRTERQRTVSATVAWSYELLDEADRRVFRRLGIFAHRVDLEAVESVAGSEDRDPLDTVAHLVDVSLLDVAEGPDGEPRVAMLETVRRFARAQLQESGEEDPVRLRHARWCAQVAAEVATLLLGTSQMKALDRIETVEQDIRAALDWCLVAPPAGSTEARQCGYALLHSMSRYWYRFGYVAEGTGWHERGLRVLDLDDLGDGTAKVDALHGAGILLLQQNQVSLGGAVLQRALDAARQVGDLDREARESNSLGIARRESGDADGARALMERSLEIAQQIGSLKRTATALVNIVHVLMDVGDFPAAVEMGRRAVAADREIGDPWGLAISECNLAFALLNAQGPDAAYEQLRRVAPGAVALADTELTIEIIEDFAAIWAAKRDDVRAARLLGATDTLREAAAIPRTGPDEAHLGRCLAPARDRLSPREWRRHYDAGALLGIEDALAEGMAHQEVSHEVSQE